MGVWVPAHERRRDPAGDLHPVPAARKVPAIQWPDCAGTRAGTPRSSTKALIGKIKQFLRTVWQDPNYETDEMSCPEITIEGINEELYAKLLGQANAAGAKFDGAKVTIHGLDFDWNYDSAASILHITCTWKPFYASCSMVEEKIRELVNRARTGI
jgi:hypothetical protein